LAAGLECGLFGRGLAKAAGQLHLTAIVYNLKRTLSIVTATA
jgi:hypothetical protein